MLVSRNYVRSLKPMLCGLHTVVTWVPMAARRPRHKGLHGRKWSEICDCCATV